MTIETLENPFRGRGIPGVVPFPNPWTSGIGSTLSRGFDFAETPLFTSDLLPGLHLKDERGRLGLGSFKALGAAYVVAKDGANAAGRTYIAASAGNHGISLAAGARAFGAKAIIVLAETVPEGFADKLRGLGAEVRRAGAVYEESMAAAKKIARTEHATLLSDSSWHRYTLLPSLVMEGYTEIADECARQMEPPSHIFLQAGVGGLAAGFAVHARKLWGDGPKIVVVEPEAAPALQEAIRAGKVVPTEGPVSAMGRLDCKEASQVALAGLARDADLFMTVSEDQAADAVDRLDGGTTPSGAAGVAGALAMDLPQDARVLCILSEQSEAAA